MAVTARQNNKQRKDGNPPPSNANRRGVWRGGPPSFTNSHQTNRNVNGGNGGGPVPGPGGFTPNAPPPPHSQQAAPLHGIHSALGSHVIVFTRNGAKHSGHLESIDPDGTTFTLRGYRDLSAPPSVAEKDSMRFPAVQLMGWQRSEPQPPTNGAGPGKGFRTDTDISGTPRNLRERELQAWTDGNGSSSSGPNGTTSPGRGDEITFGTVGGATSNWDQFSVNQQLFGVTTNYDEELYTTKLDRSRPDYKERERHAMQIANEIQSGATSNPHIAEERNLADDSGIGEEDKYGAVVRAPGSYVPPGARAAATSTPTGGPTSSTAVATLPEVVVKATNGSDGSAIPTISTPAKENNLVGSFRDFVTNEKQRLAQKKQQIVKKEKDERLADLLKFSKEFKLNRPIPPDLVPILAKDEAKQKELVEKSTREAESTSARTIGAQVTTAASARPGVPAALKATASHSAVPPLGPVAAANPTAAKLALKNAAVHSTTTSSSSPTATPTPAAASAQKPGIFIQKIPPFRGKRTESTVSSATATSSKVPAGVDPSIGASASTSSNANRLSTVTERDSTPSSPTSSTSAAFKLNVKASSFKPNPNASAFKPVTTSNESPKASSSSTTPTTPAPANASANTIANADANANTRQEKPASPPNHPFFGKTIIKMNPVHIKDEFNPFRHAKIPEAKEVAPTWPYNGKKFMEAYPRQPQSMPPPQPQQHPIPPPNQPGQAPPVHQGASSPYEEDPAQAAGRPYPMVYAYPYPYPGQQQPMIPVPGGAPPAGYMQTPFVQHMHFPHQGNAHPMFPPPSMNGMPPPQGYMQQPPPGAYPPNGGPRGSMPPTPMQQHAYAFHPSPQLPHSVPYPMMMGQPQPIPQGAPTGHPYEGQGGPPVPPPGAMGVGH